MSNTLLPKWCPQCRDEFIHSMQRCPVCEVSLVAELQGEAPDGPGWVKDWAGDLDERAAEAQRLRSQWSEVESCPACETPVASDASECRECGLAFVEDAETKG